MTPAEQLFWARVQRRAATQTPDVAAAILRAFKTIREALNETELARLLTTGQFDRLFDTTLSQARLDAAFQPVRERMRQSIHDSVKYFSRDIQKGLQVGFDILNPDVITAIRALESRVIVKLQDDVREVVRAHVENGLRDGTSPKAIARDLRSVIGLSPNQEQAVQSFREKLVTGDKSALTRQLRDRRFDATLKRMGQQSLKPEQIDRMVGAYRTRMVAHNAQTIARTAASDAVKLGQHLSIKEAVRQGIYTNPVKVWIGVMDERERPEHVAMEKESVPYDAMFSNGELIPGESTYNCRCIARYTQPSTQ